MIKKLLNIVIASILILILTCIYLIIHHSINPHFELTNAHYYLLPVTIVILSVLFIPVIILLIYKSGKTVFQRLIWTLIAAEICISIIGAIIYYVPKEEYRDLGLMLYWSLNGNIWIAIPALISCSLVELIKWLRRMQNKTNDTIIDEPINTE